MNWVRDVSGRFQNRPHWDPSELDAECETQISGFLKNRHGAIEYPIPTDDLTVFLEESTAQFDQFATLEEGIEGVTAFVPGHRPSVRISSRLSERGPENRLRTTLTHELGHVKLHTFIWEFEPVKALEAKCYRDSMLGEQPSDWMEWQAGYASGAYLIPATDLQSTTHLRPLAWLEPDSLQAVQLIETVGERYMVSQEAARVRLQQLKYLLPS